MNESAKQQGLIPSDPQAQTLAMVSVIERAAHSKDVDVEKMERLLAMQERILARDAVMQFNTAMAEMQSELPVITEKGKIMVNNQVRSTYATFEDINDAVKPILQKHGFAMTFRTEVKDNQIAVTGVLMHRAGHREETSLPLPSDTSGSKNTVQAIGSSVSYGKRYVMSALLNITTRGEDDDGGGAGTQYISDSQAADLNALLEEVGADKGAFCRYFKIESVEKLPVNAYKQAIAMTEAKRKKPAKEKK